MKQYNKPIKNTLQPGLSGDNPLAMVRLHRRSLSSQSLNNLYCADVPLSNYSLTQFLANHSANTDNLTGTTKRQNT